MMDRDPTDSDFAVHFDFAVEEIQRCLGLSRGAAQAKLRELCANGLVRSWWLWMGGSKQIPPSEWKKEEVDLATVFRGDVVVSETDLDQQIVDPSRDAEIIRQVKMGVRPGVRSGKTRKNPGWKEYGNRIRKACNALPSDRGFSDERIETVTKEFIKKFQSGDL